MVASLATEFIASLVHLSSSTRKDYCYALGKACRAWASMGCEDVGMLTDAFLLSWVYERMRQISWRGMCEEVRLVDRFLRWQVRRGYLLSSPVPEWLLERFRFKCRPALVPGVSETREFIEKALHSGGRNRLRDLAIVEVLYSCGLRCCELAGLDLTDWRGDELRVRGKFGAERVVPVGAVALSALRAYVDQERPAVLCRWNPLEVSLFVGLYGRRMQAQGIGDMFHRKLGGTIRPHQLRHACATHMLKNGASIVVLRDLLGHKSINTTRIYTEVKVEDLRKALDKYHPRG